MPGEKPPFNPEEHPGEQQEPREMSEVEKTEHVNQMDIYADDLQKIITEKEKEYADLKGNPKSDVVIAETLRIELEELNEQLEGLKEQIELGKQEGVRMTERTIGTDNKEG